MQIVMWALLFMSAGLLIPLIIAGIVSVVHILFGNIDLGKTPVFIWCAAIVTIACRPFQSEAGNGFMRTENLAIDATRTSMVVVAILLFILLVLACFVIFTKPTEERAATVIYNYFEKPEKIDEKPKKFEIVSVTAIKEGMFSVIVGDYGYSVTLNKYYAKVIDVMEHGLIPSIRNQRAYKAIEGLLLVLPDHHLRKVGFTYDRDHVYILDIDGERSEVLFDEEYKEFLMIADKIPPVVEREVIPSIEPRLRDQRARQAVEILVAGMENLDNGNYELTYDRGSIYTLAIDDKKYDVLFNTDYTLVEQLREKLPSADKEVYQWPEDGSQT